MDHPTPLTPRTILLELLRISRNDDVSIRSLLEFGYLFGFTESAIRVAISRLVQEHTLKHDQRGRYRLNKTANPLSDYQQSWRLGEARIMPWQGEWLSALLPFKASRKDRAACHRALSFFGFADVAGSFWVRPHNLDMALPELQALLYQLQCPQTLFLLVSKTQEQEKQRLFCSLWPCARLEEQHHAITDKLRHSAEQLPQLSAQAALTESFLNRAEAIHCLLNDPLLPDAIMPSASRKALWQTTLQYDAISRNLWRQQLQDSTISIAHPSLKVVR